MDNLNLHYVEREFCFTFFLRKHKLKKLIEYQIHFILYVETVHTFLKSAVTIQSL